MRSQLNETQKEELYDLFGNSYNKEEAAAIIRRFINEAFMMSLNCNEEDLNHSTRENLQKGVYLLSWIADIVEDTKE